MKGKSTFIALGTILLLLVSVPLLQAQNEVHLMQSFQYDAPIATGIYGEAGLLWVNYTDGDVSEMIVAARGGIPFGKKMEVVAQFAYVKITPENFDALSGLADIGLFGRYNFYRTERTSISAGPFLTLPIGKEDVGQGNFNYGAFAALRHRLPGGICLTGNVGLEFYKTVEWNMGGSEEKYTNQLFLGGGVIAPLCAKTHLIGEIFWKQDWDYLVLSGGVDHKLGPGRIRAGVGFGLDDGAPDLMVAGSYLMNI